MYSKEDILEKTSTLIDKENYKEAQSTLLNFIENNKNIKIDAKVYYLLYLSCNALKESKSAKKYLEKCLKINNNNHIVLNNLANIYLIEGNALKAERYYLKSFESKNDYLIVIINLAIFYQDIGKLEEAKKFYLKAIDVSPKQISIYYNLSRIDKKFMNKEKLEYLAHIMRNEKIKSIDMSFGFFLLAEYERKQNFFIKEIEYLEKAHQYIFNEKLNKNNQTLNYWHNIIPKKFDKFKFINENQKNELINLKPIAT